MEQVHQRIQHSDTSPLAMEGYMTAKRLFGSSFGFIDMVVNENEEELVQLMVKREEYMEKSWADCCMESILE